MRLPVSEPAKRIAAICHRRLTTPWLPKEIKAFRLLVKSGYFESLDDLELIERYCAFERRKGDKGFHRREVYTLLNNWTGELDRATEWGRTHPKERKIIPMPLLPSPEQPMLEIDHESVARFKADYELKYGRPLRGA